MAADEHLRAVPLGALAGDGGGVRALDHLPDDPRQAGPVAALPAAAHPQQAQPGEPAKGGAAAGRGAEEVQGRTPEAAAGDDGALPRAWGQPAGRSLRLPALPRPAADPHRPLLRLLRERPPPLSRKHPLPVHLQPECVAAIPSAGRGAAHPGHRLPGHPAAGRRDHLRAVEDDAAAAESRRQRPGAAGSGHDQADAGLHAPDDRLLRVRDSGGAGPLLVHLQLLRYHPAVPGERLGGTPTAGGRRHGAGCATHALGSPHAARPIAGSRPAADADDQGVHRPEKTETEEAEEMKTAEGRGPTLDEAVDAALIQLAESRRNVDVKVLSESASETVVEVTVIEQGSGNAGSAAATDTRTTGTAGEGEVARQIVEQLLAKMGIQCQVGTRLTPEAIVIDVSGRDLGMLIGWRGETLAALP